ncbi:MAG: phosphodiesterase [Clostridiales bacterium]|nr:phosphodiesterase [Clostridiales bacterium]
MKLLIASDIHGSAFYCEKLLGAYRREKAGRLLLLGDILYHGPRNDLPKEYAPKAVIGMLNAVKGDILCVRGNCDTEVDQMVLEFPIMAEYAVVADGDTLIYATHGHRFGCDNPPPLKRGSVLLCGHTHIPACRNMGDFVYLNPGSVSIPKENSAHGYMTFENGVFSWKTLEGEACKSFAPGEVFR